MHISCARFPSSSHVLFRFSCWWLLPALASSFHFGSTATLNLVLYSSSCHLTDSSFHSLKPRHQTFFLPIIFIPKSDSIWHLPLFDFFNLSQPGSEVHVCLQLWQFGSYIGSETLNLFRTVRQGFLKHGGRRVSGRDVQRVKTIEYSKKHHKKNEGYQVLHEYSTSLLWCIYIRIRIYTHKCIYIYTYVYYI